MSDFDAEREIGRKTRRSFLVGGLAAVMGAGAWEWVRTRRMEGMVQWPLRVGLEADGGLSRDYFNGNRLVRTYPASAVQDGRPNGRHGIRDDVEADWKLHFEDHALSLDDIKALPKMSMVTELNCIEGWTNIQQWGGVRFSDFVAKYAAHDPDMNWYVSLETPNGEYYVSLDMASAMHRQTLLCYEMNERPLEEIHGAPLRLVVPVKYGIKNLKRIGKIAFSPTRPPDYWAERGYDWYAGL